MKFIIVLSMIGVSALAQPLSEITNNPGPEIASKFERVIRSADPGYGYGQYYGGGYNGHYGDDYDRYGSRYGYGGYHGPYGGYHGDDYDGFDDHYGGGYGGYYSHRY
ncbi:probable peroxisomal membrane protein PEX13 [Fopius arisanus]|uniref:Probable peroxisomal membrane protein PEX13 n=1 Tax=Fopius arisanus TaxID=64838 RepID=A0A9R1T7E5_9HYME|nr:PREDICTED: probable peroxisomal membrane protein PEX13 [Fopius arisanus]XP_011304036.1 PREDICTED: probable peroxisomal membrane protein PEX13 [Fopius arisanus]